jgi:hypothetical protein
MNNEYSATEQPDPIHNEKPAVWELVIELTESMFEFVPIPNEPPAVRDLVLKDMRDRDEWGRSKYKTPLQPFNGRDALVDFYQELLDSSVYLQQYLYEQENTEPVTIDEDVFSSLEDVYEEILGNIRYFRGLIYARDGK